MARLLLQSICHSRKVIHICVSFCSLSKAEDNCIYQFDGVLYNWLKPHTIHNLWAVRYNWLKNYEGLLLKLVLKITTELSPVPLHKSSPSEAWKLQIHGCKLHFRLICLVSAAEVKYRGKNEYTQRQKIIESITRTEQRKDKGFELNIEELKGFWSPGFLRAFIYSTNTCLGMSCDFKFQKPIMKLVKVFLLYILYKEVNRLPNELRHQWWEQRTHTPWDKR